MPFLFFAGVIFISWVIFIIRLYYSGRYGGPNHIETFLPPGLTGESLALHSSPLTSYFIAMIAIYGAYKIWTIWMAPRESIKFGFGKVVGFFLLHLAILCISFFSLPESGTTRGFFSLFIGILAYLLYPIILILLTRTAGLTILRWFFPNWNTQDIRMRLGVETSIGFCVFVTLLLVVGLVGFYNLASLIIIGIVFLVLSFPNYRDTWDRLRGTYFEIENHKTSEGFLKLINPYLLSGEFAFIVLTFIMGVSFISIYRPMPIGWDDLGVYMNFPKMMAMNESILQGIGYSAWQLITGTGFLLGKSATQAFFVNQIGGILSVIMLALSFSYFFTNPKKKYFIALPILLATLWYALPMIVFQQAKDMKLDPALFFFSIAAITALVGYWDAFLEKETVSQREKLYFIAIIGIMVGFAFTVKLTTIMLIIASLGFIAFRALGFLGFIGYAFLFVAVFTKLHLWKMLGIVMPLDDAVTNISSYSALAVGVFCIGMATFQKGLEFLQKYVLLSVVFLLGFAIALSPWTVKHIGEIGGLKKMSVQGLIGGSGGMTIPDFRQIYTDDEIKTIKANSSDAMTSSGQSQNEDMGRYFGYETGLNNYLKLPPNLTFQINQPGEFTDITYVFLALFPVLFLFLRGRNQYLYITILIGTLIFFYLYWFTKGDIGKGITTLFSTIELPLGYVYIFAGFLLSISGLYFLLEKNEQNKKIIDISVFLSLYSFIFLIAAYGIVWYGIAMYFCLLLIIGIASLSFVEYDTEEAKLGNDVFMIKGVLSLLLFMVVATYYVRSSYPHAWSNLRQSYYAEYKAGELTKESAIFRYRSDYLDPIAYMNLLSPEQAVKNAISLTKNANLLEFFTKQKIERPSDLQRNLEILQTSVKDQAVRDDAKRIGQSLYEQVLYPDAKTENMRGIYRIGTFMTYFINDNRVRYLEDSLIFTFKDYFYHPSPEVTVDRMKKMNLGFLLTDLNAATIDRDPRRNLTTRFENLLRTFPAQNLELISTDSYCLHIAIDDARKGLLKGDDYIDIAGVNYESYRTMSGRAVVVNRQEKKTKCYNYILDKMFTQNAVSETSYSYLLDIKNLIVQQNAIADAEKLSNIMNAYIGQSWFALFKIKDDYVLGSEASLTVNTGSTLSPSTLSGGVQ